MKVVGIDLSMSATGIAVLENGVFTDVCTVKTQAADWSTGMPGRQARLRWIASRILQASMEADLVSLEGPSYNSRTSGTWDRAGLWWETYNLLTHAGLRVAIVPPTVRAKWSTGRGGAGKTEVAAAVARLWPAVPFRDDNQADAMVLAAVASGWLGCDVAPPLKYRVESLSKIEWPITL